MIFLSGVAVFLISFVVYNMVTNRYFREAVGLAIVAVLFSLLFAFSLVNVVTYFTNPNPAKADVTVVEKPHN
jgi:uncharacterized PurR-regulated membrane protein YhhQ (DUF165 family)